LDSNNNKTTYKEFFECLKTSLCNVQWFVFLEFLTPFSLGGCNFLISNPFLTIAKVSDAPRVQVLFWHQKHPLDLACPERLSVQSLADLP
jgi:hypothetical protein